MNVLGISLLNVEGESFAMLSAGNNVGTKIVLRISVASLFEENGQILMNQVFGPALACLIRGEERYRELENEHQEKEIGLVRGLDELETF